MVAENSSCHLVYFHARALVCPVKKYVKARVMKEFS